MFKLNKYFLLFSFLITLKSYSQDIYSSKFIKSRIVFMNSNESIIKAKYTSEFKTLIHYFKNLTWFEKAVSMTDYYFPLIDKKTSQYNLPKDLKYIAVIESGLRPKIKSSAGATGLFQFMESTGKVYGLKKSKHINLFYDIVASTDCAMRYFKDLYNMYNDWKFTISSYNYGQGNVNKKILETDSKNFNDVYASFPKETKNYIKHFLVVKYLIENKNFYFPNRRHFKYVFTDFKHIKVKNDTYIKKLAKQYQINENLIRFANPQIITNYIPKGTIVYLLKN